MYYKKDELYCACGRKEPNPNDYGPCSRRHYIEDLAEFRVHMKYCPIEHKKEIEAKEKEYEAKRNSPEEKEERAYGRRVAIGWILVVVGLIVMYSIGVSEYEKYAWVGMAISIFGIYRIIGLSGIIGAAIGGLFDTINTSVNVRDIANNVSMTQTKLEGRNIMFGKDVMGQKIDNPLKK